MSGPPRWSWIARQSSRFAETLLTNNGRLAGHEVSDAIRAAERGWPTPLFTAQAKFQRTVELRRLFELHASSSMTAEELAAAWSLAEDAAWTGELPETWRRSVPVSSGSDWYYEAVAANEARRQRVAAYAAGGPELLRSMGGWPP
jgi:hypothetical protein